MKVSPKIPPSSLGETAISKSIINHFYCKQKQLVYIHLSHAWSNLTNKATLLPFLVVSSPPTIKRAALYNTKAMRDISQSHLSFYFICSHVKPDQ